MPLKDSYSALLAQAEALEKYGRLDDALEIYERVVKRLSKVSDETFSKRDELRTYLVKAGVSAIGIPRGQGDFDKALEIIAILEDSVLARETDVISFMRVQVSADAGRIDEAMELLHTIAERPDAETRHHLDYTVEALWNDRPEDALRLVEAIDMDALQTEETDAGDADEEDEDEDAGASLLAQVWFMRFRIYAKLGQLEEAEAAWNEARQAAPDDPPGSVEIVEMFLEHEDYEKALHYADMDSGMYRRGLLRGVVAAKSGKNEWAADEWWRVTREKCDEEDDGFPSWIECALRQDDIAKAEAAIAAGLEKYPRSARLLVYRGIELAKKGEIDSAVQWLQAVARANQASKFNRSQLIYESDRWLIEQAIKDEETRQAAIDALFTPPEDNEPEAELETDEANIQDEGEE